MPAYFESLKFSPKPRPEVRHMIADASATIEKDKAAGEARISSLQESLKMSREQVEIVLSTLGQNISKGDGDKRARSAYFYARKHLQGVIDAMFSESVADADTCLRLAREICDLTEKTFKRDVESK